MFNESTSICIETTLYRNDQTPLERRLGCERLKALYANVLVEKRTLVEKSKILTLKPNCIYSMQSIEQHYYRETEEQNCRGCKLLVLVKKDAMLDLLRLRNVATITVRMVLISRSER